MKTAPSSAATNASGWNSPAAKASEGPTSTGATAAGSVRTRAAISQMRAAPTRSGPLGEAGEIRSALLAIGVAPLLRLLAAVEEEVRVVGELLDARQAVLGRVEARFHQPQRKRRDGDHLPAPRDRLVL